MDQLVAYKDKGIVKWKRVETAQPSTTASYRDYLGETIRETRKARNLAMRDLAGVSIGHISEIERGKKESSSEVIETLCNALGIKVSELLRMTAEKLEKVGK